VQAYRYSAADGLAANDTLPLQRATLRLLGDVRSYALLLENKILSSAATGTGSQKARVAQAWMRC
jgi:hypothetical protein